jgi:hypothetical protein
VERLTVYRHFPEERALLSACSAQYTADNPPPNPGPWSGVRDPEERLSQALAEVYSYYRRTEPMVSSSVRDAPLKPVIFEVLAPFFAHWERMRDVLAVGWGGEGSAARAAARRHSPRARLRDVAIARTLAGAR